MCGGTPLACFAGSLSHSSLLAPSGSHRAPAQVLEEIRKCQDYQLCPVPSAGSAVSITNQNRTSGITRASCADCFTVDTAARLSRRLSPDLLWVARPLNSAGGKLTVSILRHSVLNVASTNITGRELHRLWTNWIAFTIPSAILSGVNCRAVSRAHDRIEFKSSSEVEKKRSSLV